MTPGLDLRNPSAEALRVVASALRYEKLSDLPKILQEIGEATGSFAVLLWELAPGVQSDDPNRDGQLFVLADWLANGDPFASHYLGLGSVTGRAILGGCSITEEQVNPEKAVHDFFKKYAIRSFRSIPVSLGASERGAVNFYRTEEQPMSEYERAVADAFSEVLPQIYRGLRERSSLQLMGKLNRIIQVYEGEQDRLFHHTARAALAQMANAVADEFRCLEASIFLVAVGENEHAQLEATTFSPYVMKDVYARGEPGLTGWILGHERSVRIFDLKFFDRDHQAITKDYDGLTWSGQPHLLEVTRAKLGLSEPDYLQPLSFMGVPIKVGKELLGVIRCCTPLRAPYYFDEQDVKLLELAASQIGQYWKNWIQWVAIQNENRSWQSLVRSVRDLIRAGSSRIEADVSAMLKQVLAVARDTIGEASTVDVRLFDPGRGGLYFAEVAGEGWKSGNLKIDQERLEEVFPLDKKSAGAWVYKENRVRVIPDVKKDSQYIGRFPNVKSMVIAPVSSGRERYGVLDVRFTKEAGIPPQASAIAELLGQQLGLYLNLSSTLQRVREAEEGLQRNVAELRGAKAEREKEMQVQKRVFEDLKHQLQGPILQAHARISKQIRGEISAGKIESNEKAVRGLVGKAKRVVSGMQVFVDLAEQKKLRLKPVVLEKDRLLKMLIEACIDSTFLEGLTSRGLKSWVDEASFDVLNYTTVKCDVDLLEQAVYNIIDNACKYSFSLQTIRVAGGLGTDGRFYISVVNKGLPLTEEEIPNVAKRGWRGMNSVLATGQGSGIGCWFVDQVMTAHGGRLVLSPTTPEQLTEVRLQF